MKTLLVVFMVAAAMLASSAQADFVNGNRLYKMAREWKADEDTEINVFERGVYMGYLMAVSDMFNGITVCLPGNVTVSQMGDVVLQWLEAHPEKRHHAADSLVAGVLIEAFPCKIELPNVFDK